MADTIAITGGNGFVGRHLIEEFRRHTDARLVVLDRHVSDLPPGVEGHEADMTDIATYAATLRGIKPDWIVHLAAVSSVGFSLANEDITRTVNVFGTKSLIEQALSFRSDTKFLIVSSADLYGKGGARPLPELSLSQAHPKNPYAQSKLEMEQMIEKSYNSHCIRVRPFPHIGPGQKTGFVTADFASQIAAIEKGKQDPVMLVGNLEAQRDFTDVRDVVRAYRLLMQGGSMGEVYHVASAKAHSIQTILDMLLGMSNVSIGIEQDSSRMRPSDIPILVGSIDKITKQVGWRPEISLSTTLHDTLEYWRSQV